MKNFGLWMGLMIFWVAGAGCKGQPSSDAVVGDGQAPAQVLTHFRMQDIRAGTKYVQVESEEGHLMEAPPIAKLNRPLVTFYKRGAVSSTLKAPQGQVQMDTHEISAWGGVVVVTPDSSTLTTDRLRYDPQRRKLLSEDVIHLEKPDSVTEGQGLEAEPDLSRVKMGHEKVRLKNLHGPKAVT